MNKKIVGCGLFLVIFLLALVASPILAQKRITLTGTFAAPKARWDFLLPLAEKEFEKENPGIDLVLDYEALPYGETRTKLITMMAARTHRDLISVDCIWLGEFAEGGFLKDITKEVNQWGRMKEWYAENRKGSMYKGRYYGIWSWTDARLLFYWKDMLKEAGVAPDELRTWGEYIAAGKKLNEYWRPQGVEGILLIGDPWRADWWYPYLWMLGGEIIEKKDGKWYPAYYSKAGIVALQFLRDQVEAGIRPLVGHRWGERFANRKYVTWLGGTWAFGKISEEDRDKVGMIGAFPVPTPGLPTSTMLGGWVISISSTSKHSDIAWEFLKFVEKPEIMVQMLSKFGYLPTQRTIAEEEPYKTDLVKYWGWGRWTEITNLLPLGKGRPNIAEYPKIAEHIAAAIDEVYAGKKTPEQALKEAAEKSAKVLGWPGLVE